MGAKGATSAKPVTRRKYFPILFIFDSPYSFSAQTRVGVSGASRDIGANSLEAQWSAYGSWVFLF
jgi:hypothetical protein